MSDLAGLAAELRAAAERLPEEGRKVVTRGAAQIKDEWRANAKQTAPRHAPAYPYSITYDVHRAGPVTEAEIGPDKERRQGALGNLLEFGSVHNPPHNDGGRALDEETPRFVRAMGDLADGIL